jgi:hypothetical protein
MPLAGKRQRRIPKEFHTLWQRYKDEWIQVLGNDSESQQPALPP